jgi:glycosyltransferase involved in cell wall biosynthesis
MTVPTNPFPEYQLSILIPAYNEAAAIGPTLEELLGQPELAQAEIIVIDDGSTDATAEQVARFERVRLVSHRVNRGYGSAITTGTRQSKGRYIVWYDADGQHKPDDLLRVARTLIDNDLDYCIGIRDPNVPQAIDRRFGKVLLAVAVRIAAGQPVRDFNSGLRGFKREILLHYLHLLPRGFGASTLTTLLMLERGHIGAEIPIRTRQRIGTSTLKPIRDGARTLMIVLRIFLLFKPLLFFGSIGAALIAVGSVYGLYEAFSQREGFPVLGALVIILGVQSLFFGLLNDQISLVRRERLD